MLIVREIFNDDNGWSGSSENTLYGIEICIEDFSGFEILATCSDAEVSTTG